jgi:diaminopimelate decarboxylase
MQTHMEPMVALAVAAVTLEPGALMVQTAFQAIMRVAQDKEQTHMSLVTVR